MQTDWTKLKRFALWLIPWALWSVAIVWMTAPVFGTRHGDTISFTGPQFVAWAIAVVALLRAIDIWITQTARGLVGNE